MAVGSEIFSAAFSLLRMRPNPQAQFARKQQPHPADGFAAQWFSFPKP
jgi:hypothetical protein